MLIASGLTTPLSLLTLSDKQAVIDVACLHYVLLIGKAEVDKFLTGLSALGDLDTMRSKPELFQNIFCIG